MSCPACRDQLERFRRCSQVLRGGGNTAAFKDSPAMPAMEKAKDRVWEKLRPLDAAAWGREQRKSFLERTVAVPLPAVAAAAAILFIAFALVLSRRPVAVPQNQEAMAATGMMDMQGIVPVSNMNDVLQYLGNQDTTDIVIIRLPESKSFSSSGEPTILKAADYSRRAGTP